MRCESCGHNELFGKVTIVKLIPLAHKGGGLNMSGQKIGQVDVRKQWADKLTGKTKLVRGPIFCGDCSAEHYYIPGATPALRKGSYEEAVEEFGE